ncbi:MAG: phosphotransferase [Rhodoferax sp.]|nr:phosphotransferase [Rhodoferax sp.]
MTLPALPPFAEQGIGALPCWRSPVDISPLPGGMTNHNFLVRDGSGRFVVRLGQDLPQHGVMRFNELAAARAAHAAGVAPEVVYAQDGVMVTRYIESRTLVAADLRDPQRLDAVVGLLRRCHKEVALHLRGPALMFWVFQVIRNYCATLDAIPDNLLAGYLPSLKVLAARLEAEIGPVDIVFGHNDLLCGNFLDDGQRLWLIDWEYAGFNSPLFDLANLSANNRFAPELDAELLARYLDAVPSAAQRRSLAGLRQASLLREVLWGAVSHHHPGVDFDFAQYTQDWLAQLELPR